MGVDGKFDAIAKSVFTPLSGQDTTTSLQAVLQPGRYGLIFGSGLFGANGKTTLTLLQPAQVISKNANNEWFGLGERRDTGCLSMEVQYQQFQKLIVVLCFLLGYKC